MSFDKLVKDIFNVDTEYLGKACGKQTKEQLHCMLSNLILKGRLCEAFIFVCVEEMGGGATLASVNKMW